jgi:hypothetical protein
MGRLENQKGLRDVKGGQFGGEGTVQPASPPLLVSIDSTELGGHNHPESDKDTEADGQHPIMLQKAEG